MGSKRTKASTPPSMPDTGKLNTAHMPHELLSKPRIFHQRMSCPGCACLCQYRFAGLPLNKAVISPEACPLLPHLFLPSFFTPVGNYVICPKNLLFHLPKLASREGLAFFII